MNQALRDTIQYHVGRGFELETLTPDNRATLVRNGEVLRLRMEGAAVFLQREAQPATAPPPGMPWLAIALLALSLIVALALLIFAVLPQVRGQPGVDSETAATSATTPPAAAAAITATAVSVTATAPAAPTLLPVSDQRFAAVATTVSIGGAGYHTSFFVVAHEGDADRFGDGIAHSDLLPAGAHEGVEGGCRGRCATASTSG